MRRALFSLTLTLLALCGFSLHAQAAIGTVTTWTAAASGSPANLSITVAPSSGDLVLCNVYTSGTATQPITETPSSGWTVAGSRGSSTHAQTTLWRIAGAGETSYTFTPAATSSQINAICYDVPGANTSIPIDQIGQSNFANASPVTTPAEIPSHTGDLAIGTFYVNDSTTFGGSWTVVNAAASQQQWGAYGVLTGSPTTSFTGTFTASRTGEDSTILIAPGAAAPSLPSLFSLLGVGASSGTGIIGGVCFSYPFSGTGCPDVAYYTGAAAPFPVSTAAPIPVATPNPSPSPRLQGERNMLAWMGDPYTDTDVWFCWPTSGNVMPACARYNFQSATLDDGPVTLNTKSTQSNPHETPWGGYLGYGYSIIFSDGYEDCPVLTCAFSSGGFSGTSYPTQFVNIGKQLTGGVANVDASASGSLHSLAVMPITEGFVGTWGNPTTNPSNLTEWSLDCGAGKKNASGFNYYWPGITCTVLYPVFDSVSHNLTHLYEDTGASGDTSSTLYDVLSGSITSAKNGTIEPGQAPHTDLVGQIKLTASGSGSGGIAVTLPNVGSFAGGTCTWSGTDSATIATTVSNFVSNFNSGTNISGCSGYSTYYVASIVANANQTCSTANDCIAIKLKTANPVLVGAASAAISSPNSGSYTDYSNLASGSSTFNAYFGGQMINGNVQIFDPQMDTGTDVSGGNSADVYAPFAIIMCATGPNMSIATHATTWGTIDCGDDGGPTFTTWPGDLAGNSFSSQLLFGGGSPGQCVSGTWPNCTSGVKEPTTAGSFITVPYVLLNSTVQDTNTVPFSFDYSWSGGNGATSLSSYPIYNATIAENQNLSDGDMDYAYACGNASSGTNYALCTSRVDPTTCTSNGCTNLGQHFIDSNTGTFYPHMLRIFEKANGQVVVYAMSGDCGVWPAAGNVAGSCMVRYISSDNTMTSWSHTVTVNLGGSNTLFGTWEGAQDNSLRHLFLEAEPYVNAGGSALYPFDVFETP